MENKVSEELERRNYEPDEIGKGDYDIYYVNLRMVGENSDYCEREIDASKGWPAFVRKLNRDEELYQIKHQTERAITVQIINYRKELREIQENLKNLSDSKE